MTTRDEPIALPAPTETGPKNGKCIMCGAPQQSTSDSPEKLGGAVDALRREIVDALRGFSTEFGIDTPVIGDGLGWIADQLERGGKADG